MRKAPGSAQAAADPILHRPEHPERIGDEPPDEVGTTIANRSAKVVREGRPLAVHPETYPSEMPIEDDTVDRSSVPVLDHFEVREECRGIDGRVSRAYAISNER